MILNELLEDDLQTLKESNFVDPLTKAEFNRIYLLIASLEWERKLGKGAKFHFSKFDENFQEYKSDQLKIVRSKYGT
jgi:hypothetical protein